MNQGIYGLTQPDGRDPSRPYATPAQARAQTSAASVISPAMFQEAQFAWVQIDISQYGSGTLASGGSTAVAGLMRYIGTTVTANGSVVWRAIAAESAGWGISPATSYQAVMSVDWSKPRAFQIRLTSDGTYSTNSVLRCQWGKNQATTTVGQMSTQGIGFEIRNRRIWLTAHNGASLTAVDSGRDMGTSYYSTVDFLVTSDGAGNVALFMNGTQVATTVGGPTTTAASAVTGFTIEVTNGGDAANIVFRWLNYVKFLVGR